MKTYQIVKINSFPSLNTGESIRRLINFTFPGFNEDAKLNITCISLDYHGFEYFEIYHEMIIKDRGLAFGFIDRMPQKMEFENYKKGFTINGYLRRNENFILLSQMRDVLRDFIKTIKHDKEIGINLELINLDFDEIYKVVDEYSGVWMKGISSRITSTGMFGADLGNEPLFKQLKSEGASLTSVIIPYRGIQIQINRKACISSHVKFQNIDQELELIKLIKKEIIDKVIQNNKDNDE